MPLAWILLGALAGAALARAALGRRASGRVLALGLVVAASIHVVISALAGVPAWIATDLAGVVLFGALAWRGVSRPAWMAVAWGLHPLWDLGMHLATAAPGRETYAWFCLGVDLAVAATLFTSIDRDS